MVKGIYFSPFKDKEDIFKFQKFWRKKFKNFEISEIRNKSGWLVDSLTKGLAMTGLQCNFEKLTEENSKKHLTNFSQSFLYFQCFIE